MDTATVFKLDNDTFLSIFDSITSQNPDRHTRQSTMEARPLTIVRAASQVCQRWRGLLLSSPWIWGRLVDLDADSRTPVPRHAKWLEEVFIRSQSAPLWIYGHVQKSGDGTNSTAEEPNIESYFIRVLGSWERIEKLSVFIKIKLDNKEAFACILTRFLFPAPILNLFDVYFSLTDPLFRKPLGLKSSNSLFANSAPSLRTIKAHQFHYKLDSPWLSHIREIDPLTKDLTLQDVFNIFRRTPMIERIGIYDDIIEWPDQTQLSLPELDLPHLVSMTLSTSFSKVAAIIDHISPGRLSTLIIRVRDNETTYLESNCHIPSSFKANLPSYISSYLTTTKLTRIQLSMGHRRLRLLDASNIFFDDSIANFQITIDADRLSHQHDWDSIITSLLYGFTEGLRKNPSALSSVTELRLLYLDVQPTIITNLHSTFAIFRDVQHINADEHFLRVLSSPEHDPEHVLFPKLHTLHFIAVDRINTCADLIRFVMNRRSIGFPLAKLDLGSCFSISEYADVLCDLDEAHGLEVVWITWEILNRKEDRKGVVLRSYICGTDGRERLKELLSG